ncbi:hypothetical protein STAQ_27720 [Allostella sp. ATCC 35155]|nr:hypothetical protein STAQ_27720 [Stella sp. ATCC 35155]
MFTVSTPAESRQLLTIEQLRAAAGVTGTDQDAVLLALGLRIADEIADHCRVPSDGVHPPTLLRETLVETIRLTCWTQPLILARRWLGDVSVTVDGVAVDAADLEADAPAGLLYRLQDDRRTAWAAGKVVVTYQAGFAEAPTAVIGAAEQLVRLQRSQASRDPLARSERVRTEGVEEIQTDFWVGPVDGQAIPSDVADRLARYVYHQVG